jgi:hypothetical protein
MCHQVRRGEVWVPLPAESLVICTYMTVPPQGRINPPTGRFFALPQPWRAAPLPHPRGLDRRLNRCRPRRTLNVDHRRGSGPLRPSPIPPRRPLPRRARRGARRTTGPQERLARPRRPRSVPRHSSRLKGRSSFVLVPTSDGASARRHPRCSQSYRPGGGDYQKVGLLRQIGSRLARHPGRPTPSPRPGCRGRHLPHSASPTGKTLGDRPYLSDAPLGRRTRDEPALRLGQPVWRASGQGIHKMIGGLA